MGKCDVIDVDVEWNMKYSGSYGIIHLVRKHHFPKN